MDKKGQNNNIEKGKIEPAGFITSVETVKAYQMVSEIGHVRVFALLMLAPGENRHFEPGENSQFQPGRNRQSVPEGCSQPRFGYRF